MNFLDRLQSPTDRNLQRRWAARNLLRARDWVKENHPSLADAITAYLAEASVSRELDRALWG